MIAADRNLLNEASYQMHMHARTYTIHPEFNADIDRRQSKNSPRKCAFSSVALAEARGCRI